MARLVTTALVVFGVSVAAWLLFGNRGPVPTDLKSPAPIVVAPPPCLHEVCAERPSALRCIDSNGHYCSRYVFDYERHCDCDKWATVAQDGGAP